MLVENCGYKIWYEAGYLVAFVRIGCVEAREVEDVGAA